MENDRHHTGIIVVKAGTDVLVKKDGSLDTDAINARVAEIVDLTRQGYRVLFVVSGAAAKGRKACKTERRKGEPLVETMVYCSIGMPRLMRAIEDALILADKKDAADMKKENERDWVPSQLLLTHEDVSSCIPSSNIFVRALKGMRKIFSRKELPTVRDSLQKMWEMGKILPVVNANDPVNSEELTNSDNDKLAGSIAELMDAEKFIILTSVPGLLANANDKTSVISYIDPRKDDYSHCIRKKTGEGNGTGGMESKYPIAVERALGGTDVLMGEGKAVDAIQRLIRREIGTLFSTKDHNSGDHFPHEA
ncbi:MAG: hypothetical protein PHS73_00745 [Candidatus Peribacteraceae bacterium]|nr:hypothetical protein [Candidatus Peribacteraceae bacterium]